MFENYSPMQLRNAIEIEMQKTSDAKTAAEIAMKRLSEDPEYYEEMFKAKDISKLTKKIITDKNGHQRTVYIRTDFTDKLKQRIERFKKIMAKELTKK